MLIKEYESKFKRNETVMFVENDKYYLGEILNITHDVFKDEYTISSGDIKFYKSESDIIKFNQFSSFLELEKEKEPYICDDCLLSHILDDVEEGELTANEAREILGFRSIDGNCSINFEDGSIKLEADQAIFHERKTSGNAYFSIFPDDEHEDAVHIEIDPMWLWTNDDIDELIEQLKLAKVGNSNNDFRVEEKIYYDTAKPLFKFEDGVVTLNNVKDKKPILIINSHNVISDQTEEKIINKTKETLLKAGFDAEILVTTDKTHVHWL